MLDSLALFDPEAVRGASAWTIDVNQSLAYALPVRSEWMPPEAREDWMVYEPQGGDGNTFVALRADLSEGQSDQDAAEEWVSALYEFEGYLNVQIANRREYYIGNERWYAVDFSYIWEDDDTPITGAFFVTNRGDFSSVYWIEAPGSDYKTMYNDTFSVMIDGFEFLSGVQPTIPAAPEAGGSLSEVYSAAGDGYRPSELTPTATFSADDDINIVFTTTTAAEVSVVFVLPDGQQVELEGGEFEAGVSDILGLDWEQYGQPWPAGRWSAEVYVDGVLETTLSFQVGA
jgi:hypothetical protein